MGEKHPQFIQQNGSTKRRFHDTAGAWMAMWSIAMEVGNQSTEIFQVLCGECHPIHVLKKVWGVINVDLVGDQAQGKWPILAAHECLITNSTAQLWFLMKLHPLISFQGIFLLAFPKKIWYPPSVTEKYPKKKSGGKKIWKLPQPFPFGGIYIYISVPCRVDISLTWTSPPGQPRPHHLQPLDAATSPPGGTDLLTEKVGGNLA